MKTSTEIGSASVILGEERAVEAVAKAGFDAWDFTLCHLAVYDFDTKDIMVTNHPLTTPDYLKFARKLRQIGEDNGIVCNQSHAPFPCEVPGVRSVLKKAIECTAEAGADTCIIHPCIKASREENAEMYLELLPFAKACGVKIAVENTYSWDKAIKDAVRGACSWPDDLVATLDLLGDDETFVACLDTGHAEMRGLRTSAVEMIHALGTRLQALHIHDTDRRNDTHQIPFSMNIDFNAIVKALKEINYNGYFTLEAPTYIELYDPSRIPEALCNLQKSVRRLADMYEGL